MSNRDSPFLKNEQFPQTSLTLHRAILSNNNETAHQALTEFLNRYWYPMYSFMRVRGESHHDAADLVQEFVVVQLLEKNQLQSWDPELGKLRAFLKTILDRFRMNEFRNASTQKRGGHKAQTHVSMDFKWAQEHFEKTVDWNSPDKIFDQQWAANVVQEAMGNLAEKYSKKGRLDEFHLLVRNLNERSGSPEKIIYREIATALDTTENNVKQKMTAFKRRFRTELEAVVANTVGADEIESELNFLLSLSMG